MFIECFAELEDPRIERKKLHNLMDILVLAVCAVASGAEGWQGIADFGQEKEDWLRQFISLKNGIPSHDCIAYVLSRLNSKTFQSCFIKWVTSIAEKTEGEIISIDGKTSRGSKDAKNERSPLHLVSAWANSNRLILGQEATAEKSNEITAIPKLLSLLDIHGCIITIDAMGCQTAIAEQVINQGGDYCLAVKDNQESLSEAIEDFFDTAILTDFKGVKYDYTEEIDKEHGRLESRQYWICDYLETLPNPKRWKGLRSIGLVKRETIKNNVTTVEKRYFINSFPANAKTFARAVRSHWGIENSLHWRLDVVMREDDCRIRIGNAPTIFSTLRHICLNLFQIEPSKLSLKRKRMKSALNDDYRANVVFGLKF